MAITGVNSSAYSSIASTVPHKQVNMQADGTVTNESNRSVAQETAGNQNTGTSADRNQFCECDLTDITDSLNGFMHSINTDIKFELHTESNTLMVQVEDSKTHRILKEVPAHELLDIVTRLRDCIGVFLDQKA